MPPILNTVSELRVSAEVPGLASNTFDGASKIMILRPV